MSPRLSKDENETREVDEPIPCDECGTIATGIYYSDEKKNEWLCEKCFFAKYPTSQRIQ